MGVQPAAARRDGQGLVQAGRADDGLRQLLQGDEPIKITTDPSGPSRDTRSTSAGTFRVQLAAPDQPGSYTLVAQGSNTPAARTAFVVNTPPRTVPPPPPKRCSDGQDNDGDGRTDYPRDPGCSSANDDNESNPPPPVSTRPAANQCTMTGTAGNDIIRGTPGADVICAGPGNDTVYGRGGKDIIRGGSANDILYGNGAADSLHTQDAGRGNDVARGGAGADSCTTDPRDVRSSC